MSHFSYPPPPPPPPPHFDHSTHAHRIPSFQSRSQHRIDEGVGRGGRGRGAHYGYATPHPPSGGHAMPLYMNHSAPHTITDAHPYPPPGNATWGQTPYRTMAVAMPNASYTSHHAVIPQPQQYYTSPGPLPHAQHQPYMTAASSVPVYNIPAYPANTFQYPPPPPPPPPSSVSISSGQNGYENRSHCANYSQHNHYHTPDFGHGQKRKREREAPSHRMQQPANRPAHPLNDDYRGSNINQRSKVKTVPAVPSFGFHGLPPKPPAVSTSTSPTSISKDDRERENRKKQKKRKTNQLGLTPKGDVHEASDDEIDEEAKYAASCDPVTVSFKGRNISISTSEEISAWIAERKRKFPTEARVAKQKALQEKRKQDADQRRKQLAEQRRNAQLQSKQDQQARNKVKQYGKKKSTLLKAGPKDSNEVANLSSSADAKEDDHERQRRKLEKHLRKAEQLRELLAQADIRDDAPAIAKPLVNPSSEGCDNTLNHDPSSVLMSSSDTDSDCSKGPPQEKSSKHPSRLSSQSNQSSQVAKPTRNNFTNVPCKYFVRDGHCRRKNCRFLHVIPRKSDKKTLLERLKEADMHEQSLKILGLIKELGQNGLLDL